MWYEFRLVLVFVEEDIGSNFDEDFFLKDDCEYLLVLIFLWMCCKRVVVFLVNMGFMIIFMFFILLCIKLFLCEIVDFRNFIFFGVIEEIFLNLCFCFRKLLFWFVVL